MNAPVHPGVGNDSATIGDMLAAASRWLHGRSDAPRLDAETLLGRVLRRPRSFLHTWPERALAPSQLQAFMRLIEQRAAGTPTAYLTGEREFWSLPLRVTPATLIPRPETEDLVTCVLDLIPPEQRWRIADLGTGSGAIALAIGIERPLCTVLATDAAAPTLAVARDNAARLAVPNVAFHHGHWYSALVDQPPFHVIVSNPPYIAAGDPHLEQGDLRFEPPEALVAGPTGLEALTWIIQQARPYLLPGGWLALEHGYDQGPAVAALLRDNGFTALSSHLDSAGIARIAIGRTPAGASLRGQDRDR